MKKAVKKSARKSSLFAKIKKARSEFETAQSKYTKQGTKFFHAAVEDLFKKHETLQSFSWRQYTPSWNDGDTCSFGCYFDSVSINDEGEDQEDLYNLQRLADILSDKEKSRKRIEKELEGKDGWEADRLKADLESLDSRDLEEVSLKMEIKSDLAELFGLFPESLFEEMFGEGVVVINRDGSSDVNPCDHD
jgi:hypothetical protein